VRAAQRDTIGGVSTFLTYIFGLIVIGGGLFLLASFAFGRGEEMAPAPPPGVPVELPEGRAVVAEDVHALRLSVVLRGYRMEEVDWVLDALALELKDRDMIISQLRAELGQVEQPGDSGTDRTGEPPDWTPRDPELVEPESERGEAEPADGADEAGDGSGDGPRDEAGEEAAAESSASSATLTGSARERVDG
jgi:DivIVA domain-containing protein